MRRALWNQAHRDWRESYWAYRRGEFLVFEPVADVGNRSDYAGMTCVITTHLHGYFEDDGKYVWTRGGVYRAQFADGGIGTIFENEVRRLTEPRYMQ